MTPHCQLEINLDIIRENYRFLTQSTKALVSGVVKANAYGLGATQVAKSLITVGCNKFFVATLAEAIALRETVGTSNIYVLNGLLENTAHLFDEFKLIPVLNDLGQVEIFQEYGFKNNKKLETTLHLDTGLNRYAINDKDAKFIGENLIDYPNLDIKLIMSHLAASEEQDNSFNSYQLNCFKHLKSYYPSNIYASLSNSAAIFLDKDYHFDIVRSGAALYGLKLNDKMNNLKSAIKLTAKILQVKKLQTGEIVGYNGTHKITQESLVATIGLGYADGISRNMSNRGFVFINNIKAPMIGRISMDLINIDVTNLPQDLVFVGQNVEIIGTNQSPDDIANITGTIGYEVLTSLGLRYERKYIVS